MKFVLVMLLVMLATADAVATPLEAVLANQGKMEFQSVSLSGVVPFVFNDAAFADDHFKIHVGKEFMIPQMYAVKMVVQGLEFVDLADDHLKFLNEPIKTIGA